MRSHAGVRVRLPLLVLLGEGRYSRRLVSIAGATGEATVDIVQYGQLGEEKGKAENNALEHDRIPEGSLSAA